MYLLTITSVKAVALLAEGVDRNFLSVPMLPVDFWSPSSRRAWIEIAWGAAHSRSGRCRPPRGGRG